MKSQSSIKHPRGWRRPWILLGILLGLTGIGTWGVKALPRAALSQVERLTHTKLTCRSLQLHGNGRVTLEDLTIRPRDPWAYNDTLLKAGKVEARFNLWRLLLLQPRLKKLTIQDFELQALLDMDTGRWNIGTITLSSPKGRGGSMPDIHLVRGILKYVKRSGGQEELAVAVPIEATFALNRRTARGYEFKITTEETQPGIGSSVLKGYWKPGEVVIAGGVQSKALPSLDTALAVESMAVSLTYDANEDYRLQVHVRDLFSSRGLQADVFGLIQPVFFGDSNPIARVQKFFSRFEPSGKADIHLQAQGHLKQILRSRCQGIIDCKDASILDRHFPYRLDHVTGRIEFTEDSFQTQRLVGQHGDAEVLIDFWTKGQGPDWKYEVHVASTHMPLDQDLFSALGPSQKKWWSAFRPEGSIAMQYRASQQSSSPERESLLIKPLGGSAAYERFPYPLQHLSGELLFEEDRIVISNLVSEANEATKILLDGMIEQLNSPCPDVDLAIRARNIPLDETLAQSLGPSRRGLYDSLRMTGGVDADVKVFTDLNEPIEGGVGFHADVTLKDASLWVSNNQVHLEHGNGHAVLTPNSVVLKDLACLYHQTPIRLSGSFSTGSPSIPRGDHWSVQAQQIPLEHLLAALPLAAQETVTRFEPTGSVDVNAVLDKSDPNSPLLYHVQVNCLHNRIVAQSFPYPLQDVTGRITVTHDRIVLDALRARPDTTIVASTTDGLLQATGRIDLSPQGIKGGNLHFSAENIEFDEVLTNALPSPLTGWFHQLSPSGRFSLDCPELRMTTEEGSFRTRVEARLCLDDCQVNLLGSEASCRGAIHLSGVHQKDRGLSEGEVLLDMDRITLRGKSATNIHTVLHYEPLSNVWKTGEIVGRFYEGRLLGRLNLGQRPHEEVRCQIEVGFANANLRTFLEDSDTPHPDTHGLSTGILGGQISLVTSLNGPLNRIGQCQFRIRDMQAGKASILSKVLDVLRLSEPSDYVFESMEVDSYFRGEKLLIEQLDISGATMAFQGSGVMDLVKDDLNLILTARNRRRHASSKPNALQSLTEGLGGAVVRMEITGPVSEPVINTKPLPVLEESIKLLGTRR